LRELLAWWCAREHDGDFEEMAAFLIDGLEFYDWIDDALLRVRSDFFSNIFVFKLLLIVCGFRIGKNVDDCLLF
jgi:hypothetical protein